jgi:hypothetical protein
MTRHETTVIRPSLLAKEVEKKSKNGYDFGPYLKKNIF